MNYKAMACAYHTAVSRYDQAAVTFMVRDDYIQHNPKVPTGRAAFVSFLPNLQEHHSQIVNLRMLGDGPYVVMHHVWKNAEPFGANEMAAFHIIRFDSNGLIAEHWNVMAAIAPPNRSGRSMVDGETDIRDFARTDENKATVRKLFKWLINSRPQDIVDVMAAFFQPQFHQHHSAGADGIDGYRTAVEASELRSEYAKQHQVFGEGNFVLSICDGNLGGKPMAFYDLFRLEEGMIAEHWSIAQEVPTENLANDNGMFNF